MKVSVKENELLNFWNAKSYLQIRVQFLSHIFDLIISILRNICRIQSINDLIEQ